MGYPVPLTTEDWARIRYEYESTHRKLFDICAEHGISEGTLRDRVRRWGWKPRWSGPVPREGLPIAAPMIAFQGPARSALGPRLRGDEREEDGQTIQAPPILSL